jgi:hypothetical protein
MGANTSKPAAPGFTEKRLEQETLVEQAKELADNLATLDLNGVPTSPYGSLETGLFKQWEDKASKVSPFATIHPKGFLFMNTASNGVYRIQYYHYLALLSRTRTSTRRSSEGHR